MIHLLGLDGQPPHPLHSGLPYPVWEPSLLLHGSASRPGLAPPCRADPPCIPSSPDERVRGLDPIGVSGRALRHPLLSHSTHFPTSTPSLSRWVIYVCMPTRHGLPRAFCPMDPTTQGWSVSLTPYWDRDRPRKVSITFVPSPLMPYCSHRFP
jgi:hypothetical protein